MHYVVGFAFDTKLERVVMIEKNRPAKHKGLYNGVGGGVERGESPHEAMAREFREEAGHSTGPTAWEQFMTMSTEDGHRIDFFWSIFSDKVLEKVTTMTDEPVRILSLHNLSSWPTVANIKWIVEMARSIASKEEHVSSFQVIEQW